jgi:hypothetical protein
MLRSTKIKDDNNTYKIKVQLSHGLHFSALVDPPLSNDPIQSKLLSHVLTYFKFSVFSNNTCTRAQGNSIFPL